MTTAPPVSFVLPGQWLKAELDDPAAVDALTDLLPDEHRGAGAWVESLRAAGAQTLLLRPRSDPPAAIVFIWPSEQSHGDPTVAAVRARLGIEGETVPHEGGYATVRHRRTSDSAPRDVVTYAVAHPDTGRILVVRCMSLDGPFEDFMVRDFDLAAGDLGWDAS